MSEASNVNIYPIGERAIEMHWEREVTPQFLDFLLSVKLLIQKKNSSSIIDVYNTYNRLLLKYKVPFKDFEKEKENLLQWLGHKGNSENLKPFLLHLPVCYNEKWGWDLEELAEKKKQTIEELISLHTAPIYTTFFIGFLPGFPYLEGLDEKLFTNRKENPRKNIPKGSVGIGGAQTGIYPSSSPGGWQIIGNCPVPLFEVHNDPPNLIQAGDRIQFYPISLSEYEKITTEVEDGNFQLEKESWTG